MATEDDLFETVQRGGISPTDILQAVFPGLKPEEMAAAAARRRIEDGKEARLYVRGSGLTPGVSLHFAECCSPCARRPHRRHRPAQPGIGGAHH